MIHSRSYATGIEFTNQRVVVVGLGNSGGDIAVELSKIASKVGSILCISKGSILGVSGNPFRILDN